MKTITGKGKIIDAEGLVVAKYDFPAGHEFMVKDGYTCEDVDDLSTVQVYQPEPTPEKLAEEKIQLKIRELAVKEIQKEDAQFKDPRKREVVK